MRVYLLAGLCVLLVSACSNDSLFEGISENSGRNAKIEEASRALDRRNYDSVIFDMAPIYTTTALDARVGRLLASAYMGKAGIDSTLFLGNLSTTQTAIASFDVLASMFSPKHLEDNLTTIDGQRYLDGKAVAGVTEDGKETYEVHLLGDTASAIASLQMLVDHDRATYDDIIQLGIASSARFILYLGNKTAVALNMTFDNYDPKRHEYGKVPVPINTKAYAYYRESQTSDRKYYWSRIDAGDYGEQDTSGAATLFQKDLMNVRNAVYAFSETYGRNDIAVALDSFLRAALGADPNEEITDDLILEYGTEGIFTFVSRLAAQ